MLGALGGRRRDCRWWAHIRDRPNQRHLERCAPKRKTPPLSRGGLIGVDEFVLANVSSPAPGSNLMRQMWTIIIFLHGSVARFVSRRNPGRSQAAAWPHPT